MSNKKIIKNVVILILVLVISSGAYWFFNRQVKETKQEDLISSMTEFNILDKDLDKETADRYYEDFNVNKNFFLENLSNPTIAFQSLNKMGLYKKMVGDYWGAEEIWLYTYELEPKSYLINGNLANLYHFWLPDYQKAESYYLQALAVEDIAPGNKYTYFSDFYSLYRFKIQDETKTKEILDRAVSELPDDVNIYLLTANYYKEIHDTEKARYYYNEVLKINPDSVAAKDGLKNL